MRYPLLLRIAATALAGGSANAQSLSLRQDGVRNDARIDQIESAGSIEAEMRGTDQHLSARQAGEGRIAATIEGRDNAVDVVQHGFASDANIALVTINGEGNRADVFQSASGPGHAASVAQQGAANIAALHQDGSGSTASLLQLGDNNRASLTQSGDANEASLAQLGSSLAIAVSQAGGAAVAITQSN
ncbi:hypothetical protein COC42_15965 [Sphingomonas spermidinifaciens]|uniref:Curlin-associated protein n=1 Tax=Sphingomonas spermidinifaciens TaxID=1141889 RepID=A0A2A4B1Q9_9SPHN|nr:hypothetical protein [Sphingomonas spermidinifaciens]PCD01624.1 hypothetical protein COC42_15965 [Sphingomonas spermidinifaciens]